MLDKSVVKQLAIEKRILAKSALPSEFGEKAYEERITNIQDFAQAIYALGVKDERERNAIGYKDVTVKSEAIRNT